jgi:hypothetical protein
MRIRGIDRLTLPEVQAIVAAGGRFVFYEFCISLVAATLRRPSSVWLLRPAERGMVRGLPYTAVSLLLGWWGIPWGFVYTPLVIATNLSGGRDVTDAALRFLEQRATSGADGHSCAEVGSA